MEDGAGAAIGDACEEVSPLSKNSIARVLITEKQKQEKSTHLGRWIDTCFQTLINQPNERIATVLISIKK